LSSRTGVFKDRRVRENGWSKEIHQRTHRPKNTASKQIAREAWASASLTAKNYERLTAWSRARGRRSKSLSSKPLSSKPLSSRTHGLLSPRRSATAKPCCVLGRWLLSVALRPVVSASRSLTASLRRIPESTGEAVQHGPGGVVRPLDICSSMTAPANTSTEHCLDDPLIEAVRRMSSVQSSRVGPTKVLRTPPRDWGAIKSAPQSVRFERKGGWITVQVPVPPPVFEY